MGFARTSQRPPCHPTIGRISLDQRSSSTARGTRATSTLTPSRNGRPARAGTTSFARAFVPPNRAPSAAVPKSWRYAPSSSQSVTPTDGSKVTRATGSAPAERPEKLRCASRPSWPGSRTSASYTWISKRSTARAGIAAQARTAASAGARRTAIWSIPGPVRHRLPRRRDHLDGRGLPERDPVAARLGAADAHDVPAQERAEPPVRVGDVLLLQREPHPPFGAAAHVAEAPLRRQRLGDDPEGAPRRRLRPPLALRGEDEVAHLHGLAAQPGRLRDLRDERRRLDGTLRVKIGR